MLFPESEFSQLPPFVSIASLGSAVLAYDHADTHGLALTWCGRAMERHPDADQVCIAKPTIAHWPPDARIVSLLVIDGWNRADNYQWRQADPRNLLQMFTEVPRSSRTLLNPAERDTDDPISFAHAFPGALDTSPQPRSILEALTRVVALLERLLMRRSS